MLHYDPETGTFTWLIDRSIRAYAGEVAGYTDKRGYVGISVDNVDYRASRLAWLYMTGEWPKRQVDHKNKIRGDNSWNNLRDISSLLNNNNKDSSKPPSVSDLFTMLKRYSLNYKVYHNERKLDELCYELVSHIDCKFLD